MAAFLAGISRDIPWHVTAFHQDYKMQGPENMPAETLERAAAIGRAAGLNFVYAGNLPGLTGDLENTHCPGCGAAVVERRGFRVLRNRVSARGGCPVCGRAIPGIWGTPAVKAAGDAAGLLHIRCG
jgi:pyruvate formate lyase activating enzyme